MKINHPLATTLLLVFCLITSATAAPKAKLWPRWQAHQPQSHATIDHTSWQQFLTRYVKSVNGINLVNYAGVSTAHRQQLERYIHYLQSIRISQYNRNQQLAYWLNLYNAETVMIILRHYPVGSIRDISLGGGFFSQGPWDAKVLTVEGVKLSLNDIEHRIIRPIWRNPLIHFGVNCASIGCPNLPLKPFTAATVYPMLESNARQFINSPRGVKIVNQRLIVSKIFTWFSSDFGGNQQQVIAFLMHYANPALQQQLRQFRGISSSEYNWRLNRFPT